MIREFAPAKINLALHVLGRRADGYHDLDSIVAFADVGDWLEVTPAGQSRLTVTGPFAGDVPPSTDNIVRRAAAALAQAGYPLPPLHVTLEKNLPVASGIGGGSADAAAMLRAAVRLMKRAPPAEALARLALTLGADVPVCLTGRACRMQGVGERITLLDDVAPVAAVLVNPGVAVSTPEIFARMGLARGQLHREGIAGPESWRNDMTDAAVSLAPVIGEVLHALQQPGLRAARMSGSGATCFGLFESQEAAAQSRAAIIAAHPRWWTVSTLLQ